MVWNMTVRQEMELCDMYEKLHNSIPFGHVIVHSITNFPFIHMWIVSRFRARELLSMHGGFREVEFYNGRTGVRFKILHSLNSVAFMFREVDSFSTSSTFRLMQDIVEKEREFWSTHTTIHHSFLLSIGLGEVSHREVGGTN